ncbi:DUF1772 domain-containing protein [Geodermatophilus aquaeductus]|uniref:Uncharacterized membrane protein n=1 Tax=Geodermatophilus aquaeductus TaxID=1564161 RepID=A0A521EPR9_9ACTN|nr:anthrone oxygenase family protein [Geodermatophilus aquaeductus]SMO85381.1 Uncharacterized membrane protein [Geodermatophilus aquaeductus]
MTTALVLAAALGSAVVAGVFAAFSGFVVRGLAALPPATGAAAMRAVNVTALRPPLMTALFGTAALCVAAVVAVLAGEGPVLPVLAGAVAYLAGAVLVTAAANVPLNEELRRSVPGTPDGDAVWARYLRVWTRWNTVRALACTGAAAALGLAPLL